MDKERIEKLNAQSREIGQLLRNLVEQHNTNDLLQNYKKLNAKIDTAQDDLTSMRDQLAGKKNTHALR